MASRPADERRAAKRAAAAEEKRAAIARAEAAVQSAEQRWRNFRTPETLAALTKAEAHLNKLVHDPLSSFEHASSTTALTIPPNPASENHRVDRHFNEEKGYMEDKRQVNSSDARRRRTPKVYCEECKFAHQPRKKSLCMALKIASIAAKQAGRKDNPCLLEIAGNEWRALWRNPNHIERSEDWTRRDRCRGDRLKLKTKESWELTFQEDVQRQGFSTRQDTILNKVASFANEAKVMSQATKPSLLLIEEDEWWAEWYDSEGKHRVDPLHSPNWLDSYAETAIRVRLKVVRSYHLIK